jgi:hypothetical protein
MLSKDRIREVNELLERHWTLDSIAHSLKIDLETLLNIVKGNKHYHVR